METYISRRDFVKIAATALLTTFLPLGCEQVKSPDSLQTNIDVIVKHLTANNPQEDNFATEEGEVFHIQIYSDTVSFEEKRTIEISYSIPYPINHTTRPTLTIVDYHRAQGIDSQDRTIIIDVNANGFNPRELDQLRLETYKANQKVSNKVFPSATRSPEALKQLNMLYTTMTQMIVEKLTMPHRL